jgi:adenine-specific DNA glycosylase
MLGGLWELPGCRKGSRESLRAAAERCLREETALSADVCRKLFTVTHAYSHFTTTVHVFECVYRSGRVRPGGSKDALRWIAPAKRRDHAMPQTARKILDRIYGAG